MPIKPTKESIGSHSTRTATQPFQGRSIGFSFAGVRSKDVERKKDFTGLNPFWILVIDHFTRAVFGDTRVSKASPFEWLRSFLRQYSPQCPGKYVYLDQGGELYANSSVRALFEQLVMSFVQLVPTLPIKTVLSNVPTSLLRILCGRCCLGPVLTLAFGPMPSIISSLSLMPRLPLNNSSPLLRSFVVLKRISLASALLVAVFGSAPLSNIRKGIFLGFLPSATKNILWYDVDTAQVKISKHASFDECLNDLPSCPMNSIYSVSNLASHFLLRWMTLLLTSLLLESLTIPASNRTRTFGFDLLTDELNNRVFVATIRPGSPASRIRSSSKATNYSLRGAYLVAINDVLVFPKERALLEFRKAFDSKSLFAHNG